MKKDKKETSIPWHKNKLKVGGFLLAILLTAFTLRVTNIENIPYSVFPDEAQNGIDAQEANATGEYKLFYESNNGREGLFINLQALSIKTFGSTTFALKLPSIIFGTLTVLGVFLLSSELFGTYVAGLIGAYLTTFSYWAINFSRIGFRAVMVPFILTFAFYFVFRGLRTKKLHDFIFAGLVYGLGLHTYIAFRVSPLVLIALFVSLIITRENFLKNFWKHILVFAIAMMITSAPMLLDFFHWNPQHYASRTKE
ncbi:MAG: glycosyltransferase family 39 protein, partial [Candidatus Moranbacteria bacterium]|nr:glycosyltransferase family 39 protein [Candidatus Moranbacteria bacterium]